MWLLYQATMLVALLLAAPYLLLRRGRHYLATLRGRLGLHDGPPPPTGALWLHAVSVGEVGVAATLSSDLPATVPLLVTTITPTGQARARAAFAPRGAAVAYLPFDLGFAVRRFWRRFEPAALVLTEGDYWPLLLRIARRRRLPVAVINGRVSRHSFNRLRRLGRLCRIFFAPVDRFGVQTDEDRQRLIALGVPAERVATTGNLKYETPEPPRQPALEALVAQLAAGRPVLIAGSTMAGEEDAVLDAFVRLGGGSRALLVMVPRHPERWDAAAKLITARGLSLVRRSAGDEAPEEAPAVLLLDSLGELAALYRVVTLAFIGGTLVPTGGHNPLEPARFAIPIVVGPSMFNFRDMAAAFRDAGAWREVDDAAGLAAAWDAWLRDPPAARAVGQRAAALVEANRGALGRTLDLLAPLLTSAGIATP